MSTELLDDALRDICEGKFSQGTICPHHTDIIDHLCSRGYATKEGRGVMLKILPTEAGKAFLANGGFAGEAKRKLSLKKQEEFLDFQQEFFDFQRKLIGEQHRHMIRHDWLMLIVTAFSCTAAMFSAYASCSSMEHKEMDQHGYSHSNGAQGQHNQNCKCDCFKKPLK